MFEKMREAIKSGAETLGPEAGFFLRLFLSMIAWGWIIYINVFFYMTALRHFYPWRPNG